MAGIVLCHDNMTMTEMEKETMLEDTYGTEED